MATASFTQSLFGGIDPYKIQRENMQQLFAPIQQAKDPYSKIGAALGTLGGMALFGMPKDPRLAKVTEVQQTVQEVMGEAPDEATFAERLPLLQQAFTEKGLIDQAAIIAERIKALTPKEKNTEEQAKAAIFSISQIPPEQRTAEQKTLFNAAQAVVGSQKERPKLADRLVELETKKATDGLTTRETAELVALQKVVKLQSPKGVDLSGLAGVFGQEAAKKEAQAVGAEVATLQGKQQSVESLKSARTILEQGIYSGSYGEFQSELAKKSLGVVGDLKRVENTEVFLNEVNSNVIPLLQEFGGNDSNEELRFLQRLVGGDITLQESSIRRILDNAIRKIERGMQRTAAKGRAVREGKLPELPKQPAKPAQTRTTKSGVTYEIIED